MANLKDTIALMETLLNVVNQQPQQTAEMATSMMERAGNALDDGLQTVQSALGVPAKIVQASIDWLNSQGIREAETVVNKMLGIFIAGVAHKADPSTSLVAPKAIPQVTTSEA